MEESNSSRLAPELLDRKAQLFFGAKLNTFFFKKKSNTKTVLTNQNHIKSPNRYQNARQLRPGP
jgi:hypothetical protein